MLIFLLTCWCTASVLLDILPTFSPGTENVSRGDTQWSSSGSFKLFFAKLFRLVLAELALTIGIVSLGWEIFICKTLEMSQRSGLSMVKSLFEDLKHAQHVA